MGLPKNRLFIWMFGFLTGIVLVSFLGSEYNMISGDYIGGFQKILFGGEVSATGNAEIWDFWTDESYQKFLDSDHILSSNFEVQDLVDIDSAFTSNFSKNFKLRKEVGILFADMAWAFSHDFEFKVKFSISSAWRSNKYQRELQASCASSRCADAGASEHEIGLALDLGINGGNIMRNNGIYYQWLVDNAHKWGFHQTYQKGVKVDGKIEEPWHWRYVGVGLATYLHENGLSLAEYFYS